MRSCTSASLVPASVVHVRPAEVRVPPMPSFPPVESVVTLRDPVILLVPLIDNPPPPFAIWPVEVNCVQVTDASVELPVTFKVPVNVELPVTARPEDAVSVPATLAFPKDTINPLVEIRPAEVSVPAMLAFPEDTLSPFDVVTPLQTRGFVVSKVSCIMPACAPEN